MIQYIVTDALFSNMFIGLAVAIIIFLFGFEAIKYLKANRKYTNYLEAFKIAVLMKIAEDRKLPVENFLITEKEYKGLERVIKERVIEYLEEGMEEKK